MRTSRVFVLTIHLAASAHESERTLVFTILRRKADGPLLVRDTEASDKAQHPNERSARRYASGQQYVQAIFVDEAALECVQRELCGYGLPTGVVSRERRRTCRAELPCTCVLLDPWEARARSTTGMAYALYNRVGTCPRHAQLAPGFLNRHPDLKVHQQSPTRVAGSPPPGQVGAAGGLLKERDSRPGRQSRTRSIEALLATVAANGRKVALSGYADHL